MATTFMRWLETRPADYDRGIRMLTLGRLAGLQQQLVASYIQPGCEVLEIGCGTGALTVMMAKKGAKVTALDRSKAMLEVAEQRVQAEQLSDRINLQHLDASAVAEKWAEGSFEAVVSSLAFSEMSRQERQHVFAEARKILRRDGSLILLDEFRPRGWFHRLLAMVVRTPLRFLTWLLTRATTSPLHRIDQQLAEAGFEPVDRIVALGGALRIIRANVAGDVRQGVRAIASLGRLHGDWSWRMIAVEAWALFFRILPPYPKQEPGVYAIGEPGPESAVLVTGNYRLSVDRLLRAVDGHIDAWLLVADSNGINVWCGAGGGFLTAERVLSILRLSALDDHLQHKQMILPQLCANGVDGWKIREESGWEVHWGPVSARHIPAYLRAGLVKNDEMRLVLFPLRDRLEMMAATLGFYALMILLPVAIFWQSLFGPLALSLIALSTFYAIALDWLPGNDGLQKSVPLTGIALLGMLIYSAFEGGSGALQLFKRAWGMAGLSVFVGAELQGMSPEMRGEQANWGWEALIAVVLVLLYWVVPILMGWR